MEELKKPIGSFIIKNSKGTQTENGVYYHYTEVCILLKLYEKQLQIHDVSKSFTAEEVGDMLANKFSTIEEAIHYFDTVQ